MATITITATLSAADAIRHGGCQPGPVAIPVDLDALSAEQRTELADIVHERDGETYLGQFSEPWTVPTPDAAGIVAVVQARLDQAADQAQRAADREAQREAEAAEVLAERRTREHEEFAIARRGCDHDIVHSVANTPLFPGSTVGVYGITYETPAWPGAVRIASSTAAYRSDEAAAWTEELAAAREAARVAAHAIAEQKLLQAEAADREREADEREAAAERAAWIEAHGSPRLRRLVEEGIEHDAVYRDERIAFARPGWHYDATDWDLYRELRNVPQAALDMLDAARESAADAQLVYINEPADGGYDDTPICGYTCSCDYLEWTLLYGEPGALPVPTAAD